MFTKIATLSIPVENQDAAQAFYVKKLGATVVQDMPFGPDTRWVKLALPGVETNLVLATWFPKMRPGSVQGIVITTNDIAKTHAELKKRGLDISEISEEDWAKEAVFKDIDGNGWVLQQSNPDF
jgi:catechol 2,3-dioxygenase-like lactoylglutathione lyase family enzyme